mmetsp:Transcript_3892/g.8212  ORF Transcript_3892/g.8212 Transcript_3892/m.8212 type:complete len:206 (+) Transcript_3892:1244-1861(+)
MRDPVAQVRALQQFRCELGALPAQLDEQRREEAQVVRLRERRVCVGRRCRLLQQHAREPLLTSRVAVERHEADAELPVAYALDADVAQRRAERRRQRAPQSTLRRQRPARRAARHPRNNLRRHRLRVALTYGGAERKRGRHHGLGEGGAVVGGKALEELRVRKGEVAAGNPVRICVRPRPPSPERYAQHVLRLHLLHEARDAATR